MDFHLTPEQQAIRELCRDFAREVIVPAAEELLGWLEQRVADDIRLPVARARLLEWRRRDPHSALTVVEAAQERMPEEAAVLEPRRARLRRKVAKVAKVPVAHLPLFGPNDRPTPRFR